MRSRSAAGLVAVLALLVSLLPAAVATATPPTCDPMRTTPSFRGEVPTAGEAIGVELGSRDVTSEESDAYVDAVDAASPRVVSGTAGESVEGRPLRYAIVGKPGNVTARGLQRVREAAEALRDPSTPAAEARRLAQHSPAIVWVAGNVHGNEESGTDASLRVLYELADRDDCAARQILDNAVVVLLPIQNPDGREADSRRNAYGFDMNRDWFARTQPETDAKLELLRRYPPVLFIDAHEMGAKGYFFPPNADPIYHEISDESVGWINDVYGAALAEEFRRQDIPFFNRSIYDLFYMGYGDTVPSTGFIAAGMTFEKHAGDPTSRRVYEQYVTQWVSLSQAALRRETILSGWHAAYVEAQRQGEAGELEPNEIVNPGNEVVTEVPDEPVRHYFLRADDPARADEVQRVVRRLQRMDVTVQRLTAPLTVPDFRPYGTSPRSTVLPAGTFWVPLSQAQKHWVQAMLNEDTYTPFPYFYDVTAWSLPLLADVEGGRSGAVLQPQAEPVAALPEPEAPAAPAVAPAVALFQMSSNSSAVESAGWLRWLLTERWELPFRDVSAEDIAAGKLSDVDVLLVPNGRAGIASAALGADGRDALTEWVRQGGRYVGWRGGTELAAALGISSVSLAEPTSDVPGSLFHTRVDTTSPLAEGVGDDVWSFYAYDLVMRAADESQAVVTYPEAGSRDAFVSGFASGEEELGGTAAVVDEPLGEGRSVVFSTEPNFRGFTEGTQQLLRNAILGPDPVGGAVQTSSRQDRDAARSAAAALEHQQSALHVSVAPQDAAAARQVLSDLGASATARTLPGRVAFTVANPRGLSGDEHPLARELPLALRRRGVEVVVFAAP